MRTINLKEIIEKSKLDIKEIAIQLFPENKYPRLALNRVIAGEAVLDANQISKLALLINVDISDLYSDGNWKMKSRKGIHIFTSGRFRAELDSESWITKIFHRDSMFHDSIIHSGSTPLSEYFKELNKLVTKYNKHEN